MEEQNSRFAQLAEMQGLFGPVSIPEYLVQKIWMRGDFRRDSLKTFNGVPIEVISAGTWNRLDGPDFFGAELIIDGRRVRGDVEIHFYAEDWMAHGHDGNPRYGNVVLHVVLFPPRGGKVPEKNAAGEKMATLLLLPHLKVDLEEYAAEDALAQIEGREGESGVREILSAIPLDERFARLRDAAFIRWEQKLRFMQRRFEKVGDWGTLAHQLTLETLGLRRNREAMARLSTRFSPSTMVLLGAQKLFEAESDSWHLSGTRPANLPKTRLTQYIEILTRNPAWARRLQELLVSLPGAERLNAGMGTKAFRQVAEMRSVREKIASEILGNTVGGTRLDTLLADAFFPLASAVCGCDLSAWWFHWYLGDAPGNVPKLLRELGISTREQAYCNGLFQGLIRVSLERA